MAVLSLLGTVPLVKETRRHRPELSRKEQEGAEMSINNIIVSFRQFVIFWITDPV